MSIYHIDRILYDISVLNKRVSFFILLVLLVRQRCSCYRVTLVVLTLLPVLQDQPVRSGRTLHSSPSKHGCIWHHHFCSTMEASTQDGWARVVPATCPGKQEHLTVCERSSILFLLQHLWMATTSHVPCFTWYEAVCPRRLLVPAETGWQDHITKVTKSTTFNGHNDHPHGFIFLSRVLAFQITLFPVRQPFPLPYPPHSLLQKLFRICVYESECILPQSMTGVRQTNALKEITF